MCLNLSCTHCCEQLHPTTSLYRWKHNRVQLLVNRVRLLARNLSARELHVRSNRRNSILPEFSTVPLALCQCERHALACLEGVEGTARGPAEWKGTPLWSYVTAQC